MPNPAQKLLYVLQNEVEWVEIEKGKVVAGDPVEVDVLTDSLAHQAFFAVINDLTPPALQKLMIDAYLALKPFFMIRA